MAIACHKCKGTRNVQLVTDGMWTCTACVYSAEVREPEDTLRPRKKPLPIQKETLFPAAEYARERWG